MRYWTYAEIKEKVKRDLDLGTDDVFITPAEMLGYYNEAVDAAEAIIHTMYEDYFLASSTLSLVIGQSEYSLPADIYANKIRAVIYSDGQKIYPIQRVKDWKKFEKTAWAQTITSPDDYQYILKNQSAALGVKLVLFPTAKETSSNVTIWYLRNANRATVDTDVCDIPEFVAFVIAFMKVKILTKEQNPALSVAIEELKSLREQMEATLRDIVPDGETEIELDMRAYTEMS
jgi:hypothetical protein